MNTLNIQDLKNHLPADSEFEFDAVIEIPEGEGVVKYEIELGNEPIVRVDRFNDTSMRFPCNYGFIPYHQGGDNDPLDVLVITPVPLMVGCVIRVRPIGVLLMEDESGMDEKIITVPARSVTKLYDNMHNIHDLDSVLTKRIVHFFSHYKDLAEGKWVKIEGLGDLDRARRIIEVAKAKGDLLS